MMGELPLFGHMPAQAELQFAEFYRTCTRAKLGGRERATDIRARYLTWAAAHGCGSVSFQELRRLLEVRGHRHLLSNGAWYLDIEIIEHEDVAEDSARAVATDAAQILSHAIALQKHRERMESERLRQLLKQVDAVIADLGELRRSIVDARP